MSTHVRAQVIAALEEVAPDVDGEALDPTEDVLYAADLDSMDLLNLAMALEERLGVQVPERDYQDLRTIDGAVAYLGARLASRAD